MGLKVTRPTCKAGDKMRRAAKQTRGRRLGGDLVFGALDLDESW